MIQAYTVTANDNIISIAQKFYNDPNKWKDIVNYNSLDYPYIAPNLQDYLSYASGPVTFTLPYVLTMPILIPAGTKVSASGVNTQLTRSYATTQDITINPGQISASLNVQCTLSGTVGNIGAGRINQINGSNPYNITVTNPQPFSNGKTLNIATTGTKIYIPLQDEVNSSSEMITDYNAAFFKSDIFLNDAGEFSIGTDGDLVAVSGIDNLKQDLKLRIETAIGDYLPDQSFGTNIKNIATSGEAMANNLLAIEIEDAILKDPRIQDVSKINVISAYPAVNISVNAVSADNQSMQIAIGS